MRASEPLQLHVPTFLEFDSGAGDEVVRHAGNQNLAAEGLPCDPRRVVDGPSEEAVRFVQCIAGVNTDSDADRRGALGELAADLVLDRLRAGDRPAREVSLLLPESSPRTRPPGNGD